MHSETSDRFTRSRCVFLRLLQVKLSSLTSTTFVIGDGCAQGSNDGIAWTLLYEHLNDTSLNRAGETHTWALQNASYKTGFRMFRVRMTAPNSNGHLYLALSGFEIYGTLSTQPPPSAAAPVAPAQVSPALVPVVPPSPSMAAAVAPAAPSNVLDLAHIGMCVRVRVLTLCCAAV